MNMIKKLITGVALAAVGLSAFGQSNPFRVQSFLQPGLTLVVTNAAAAPFGGYTNVASPSNLGYNGGVVAAGGTNSFNLTYTNALGTWIRVTNNTPYQVAFGTNIAGMYWVTNDTTQVAVDVQLPTMANASLNALVVSNDGASFITPFTLSITSYGDTSASGTLNLIFVGVPDGIHEEWTTALPAVPNIFQWGVSNQPGTFTYATNLPIQKFAGCKSIRLRSATITTTTAANIGDAIQSLTLNGPVP